MKGQAFIYVLIRGSLTGMIAVSMMNEVDARKNGFGVLERPDEADES